MESFLTVFTAVVSTLTHKKKRSLSQFGHFNVVISVSTVSTHCVYILYYELGTLVDALA